MKFTKQFIVFLFLTIALHGVSFNGKPYTAVKDYGKSIGMKFSWTKRGVSGQLKSQWTTITFTLHKHDIYLNGVRIFLAKPHREKQRTALPRQAGHSENAQPHHHTAQD